MEEKSPDFSGKVALVTGSSRGIGRAIAQRLASAGATVVVTARSLSRPVARRRGNAEEAVPGTLDETVELIRQAGGRAIALAADLENAAERDALVAKAQQAAGRLDILVNNAGYAAYAPVADMSIEDFDRNITHYLRVPFALSKAAIPIFREQGQGWIVNIGSCTALPIVRPYQDYAKAGVDTVYASVKSALHRFTQGLAAELFDDNIAVNAVGPSTAIKTEGASELIPDGYPTEDVAYLATTVLAMAHLPPSERTGLVTYSMHFPWHQHLEVRSLDGKSVLPRAEPPAWSHPGINASGE